MRWHRHKFVVERVRSGPTIAAWISVCKCGHVERHMTGAGVQQYGWWRDLGATHEEAREHVFAGEYPPIVVLPGSGGMAEPG
jgi:hypothetical protein